MLPPPLGVRFVTCVSWLLLLLLLFFLIIKWPSCYRSNRAALFDYRQPLLFADGVTFSFASSCRMSCSFQFPPIVFLDLDALAFILTSEILSPCKHIPFASTKRSDDLPSFRNVMQCVTTFSSWLARDFRTTPVLSVGGNCLASAATVGQ